MINLKKSSNKKSLLYIGLNDHVSLNVIRSLGKKGINLYGIGNSKIDTALHSKYLTKGYVYPYFEDYNKLVDFIFETIQKHKIDYVISGEEEVLIALNKRRDELKKLCTPLFPNKNVLSLVLDKRKTFEIAKKLKIPTPETIEIKDISELEQYKNIIFPVIVKPSSKDFKDDVQKQMNFRREYVFNYETLQKIFSKFGPDLEYPIIQEYYGGQEIGFPILMHNGECVACAQYNVLRTWRVSGGMPIFRETVKVNPKLKEYSIKLLKEMKWEGVAEIDYICDESRKEIKLLEVNGRLWSSISLNIHSGMDFPHIWLNLLEGSKRAQYDYKIGVKGRLFFGDLGRLIDILIGVRLEGLPEKIPTKKQAIVEFFKAFHPSIKYDILSINDPLPAVSEVLQSLIINFSSKTRKKRTFPARIIN